VAGTVTSTVIATLRTIGAGHSRLLPFKATSKDAHTMSVTGQEPTLSIRVSAVNDWLTSNSTGNDDYLYCHCGIQKMPSNANSLHFLAFYIFTFAIFIHNWPTVRVPFDLGWWECLRANICRLTSNDCDTMLRYLYFHLICDIVHCWNNVMFYHHIPHWALLYHKIWVYVDAWHGVSQIWFFLH
jgi:hypothetical protein